MVSGGRIPEYALIPWLQLHDGIFLGSNLLPLLPNGGQHSQHSREGDLEIVVVVDGERSRRVRVTCGVTEEACDEWVQRHVRAAGCTALGLDVEWKPQFRRGSPSRVALLQLAAGDQCLLVPLLHIQPQVGPPRLAPRLECVVTATCRAAAMRAAVLSVCERAYVCAARGGSRLRWQGATLGAGDAGRAVARAAGRLDPQSGRGPAAGCG